MALDRPTDNGGSTLAAPPDEEDVVLIRLPAVGAYLSLLRTATAGLAARPSFLGGLRLAWVLRPPNRVSPRDRPTWSRTPYRRPIGHDQGG